jgi:retron-type reverse transcriptase
MDEDNRRPHERRKGVGLPRSTEEAGEQAQARTPSREGRQLDDAATKGHTTNAQKFEDVYTKLRRITEKAQQEPDLQLTSLAHLLTVGLLRDAYVTLRRDASPGIDGLTTWEYDRNLDANIEALHRRLRDGQYRAQPVRRVYIEKENGKLRPLGIPALEDKIVQKAVLIILEGIYEPMFVVVTQSFRV